MGGLEEVQQEPKDDGETAASANLQKWSAKEFQGQKTNNKAMECQGLVTHTGTEG